MVKPNEKVVKAIAGLESNPNWKVFVQWLDDSLTIQGINICELKGEDTIKAQGRNLELKDLISHINNVERYLENMQESRRVK